MVVGLLYLLFPESFIIDALVSLLSTLSIVIPVVLVLMLLKFLF